MNSVMAYKSQFFTDACSSQYVSLASLRDVRKNLLPSRRVHKRSLRRILGPDLYLHRLLTKFLMHCGNRVFPRRQILDLIASVRRADGEIRVCHHVDIRPHPRMLVALHRNHHLRRGKGLDDWVYP